jgi:hypothetical protein
MVRADVQETPPTPDQLTSILEYLGPSKAGTVVKDATGSSDALRKFKESESLFQRPLVVDWNNGRAGRLLSFPFALEGCSGQSVGRCIIAADILQLLERTRARL